MLVGVLATSTEAASTGTAYDMTRMLNEPHPLASQMGTRWNPVLPATSSVLPSASAPSIQQTPASAATTSQPTSGTPARTDAGKSSKSSGGVWRIEHGNEDRGFLTEVFEPIFDPVFGGSPTDGGLTWGWRVSYTPNAGNPGWFQSIREYLPWISQGAAARVSYSLEQEALTPSNLAKAEGRTVRPHAGHLAFDARVAVKEELGSQWQRIDTFDFVAGLVGPISGAQAVHELVHGSIDEETDAWDEIKSEPILNLNYEYGHRFLLFEPGGVANLEVHPYAGAALGNALTYGSLGLNLRFGQNLFRDMGSPRQRLLLSGENFIEPGDYWAWNIFLGAEARAMAHSVFLDGNAFRDSNSVDKRDFVYDVQMGFEGGYGAYRLSVMNVYRSREFDGQQFSTEFVRLAASAEF